MTLKKYLAYSFGTLWTIVLIMALVATIVHQVKYQDSSDKIHLEWEVKTLEQSLSNTKLELETSKEYIDELLTYWNW